MRIPLAPTPARPKPQKQTGPSPQDIRESWQTWVESKCPRTEPAEPTQRGIRILNNLKPYTPPWPK